MLIRNDPLFVSCVPSSLGICVLCFFVKIPQKMNSMYNFYQKPFVDIVCWESRNISTRMVFWMSSFHSLNEKIMGTMLSHVILWFLSHHFCISSRTLSNIIIMLFLRCLLANLGLRCWKRMKWHLNLELFIYSCHERFNLHLTSLGTTLP